MFFDAYGAGRIVDLCRRRGWLLVSPRTGVARPGEVVSALAKAVPIDPRRCFMIGHSMGAAAAIAGVPASPGVFAAVAALGGAGRIVEPVAWRGTRLEVGAGESDFALGGAKALHASARAAGVDVGFREYPGIEHLGIVQAALDDIFAAFDGVARGRTAQ